ncbi:uncharacterized protein CTRU02_209511 [Colletotrichum truncatum]|uniref:Membrane protein n=1 Tax=Colletotrichum truncatum TaxID=5467 RepID=A0ACC3YSP3_COLTU|nr:uncharacterized protein CTRU02_15265 [Colletotrichum truncatum]KAF6781236.1 membrane protein [Colletotrichum truncatum]
MTKKLHDNVSRVKKFNVLGTAIFVGLRVADVFFQYFLIQKSWASNVIRMLGGQPMDGAVVLNSTGGLNPYYNTITAMAFGSSLKQIIAMLYVGEQDTPPSSAFVIGFFNSFFNSINTMLSVWTVTSQATSLGPGEGVLQSPAVMVGAGLYLTGILAELISELQRTFFKRNPANKGKPYAGGLFSLARHINYGGYTVWRSAYAFTAAGWPWSLVVFSFFFYDFAARGVPVLDQYLSNRYGKEWDAIKTRVPYRLIPWLY